MSIIVHHLVNSRSQRILWMLEELGLDYEVKFHQRDAVTNLAPPELSAIHPLGKAPLIEVDGQVIAESGAIVEYLCTAADQPQWIVHYGDAAYPQYLENFHFAEGSYMTPILVNVYASQLGEAAEPILPRVHQQMKAHNDYMEAALEATGYFGGSDWTAADVMMSFPAEIALMGPADAYPRIADFVARAHARPAWQRARERGGGYFGY